MSRYYKGKHITKEQEAWAEVNGYDYRDGSKYFYACPREYCSSVEDVGQQFGSYPVHDDYSEESSAY